MFHEEGLFVCLCTRVCVLLLVTPNSLGTVAHLPLTDCVSIQSFILYISCMFGLVKYFSRIDNCSIIIIKIFLLKKNTLLHPAADLVVSKKLSVTQTGINKLSSHKTCMNGMNHTDIEIGRFRTTRYSHQLTFRSNILKRPFSYQHPPSTLRHICY